MRVLIVDDEAPIVEAVEYNLRKEGYETLTAGNAEQCLDIVERERPDLIILDVMLPSASGFDVCRALRKRGDVPIIMLTARAEETERVVGLELGADDYVTKPFSMRELVARVKSVLRRQTGALAEPARRLEGGGVVLDADRHEVFARGEKVELSRKEFDLLRFFLENPGRVFSRQALLDRIWGQDAYVGDRTVDVHVRWLREKIEADPSIPVHLTTIRGVGYRFDR